MLSGNKYGAELACYRLTTSQLGRCSTDYTLPKIFRNTVSYPASELITVTAHLHLTREGYTTPSPNQCARHPWFSYSVSSQGWNAIDWELLKIWSSVVRFELTLSTPTYSTIRIIQRRNGASDRIWTYNHLLTRQLLYRWSYRSKYKQDTLLITLL